MPGTGGRDQVTHVFSSISHYGIENIISSFLSAKTNLSLIPTPLYVITPTFSVFSMGCIFYLT